MSRSNHSGVSISIQITLALSGCLASAQTPTARTIGIVSDPSGSVIAGARATMRNVATGVSNEGVTNQSGTYAIPLLSPGRYVLTVEATGFRTYRREGIVLETGQSLSLDVTLELGEVAESVTVTGAASLLQSETSSLNQTVENASVINMPLASRQAIGLVRLSAGVTYGQDNPQGGYVEFAIAGGRTRQQGWQVDGGNMQGNTLATGTSTFNPSVEAVQEIRVETNSYPAEIGRATGGNISITTRSGTNEFHGVLYHYLRNNALDARSFFSPGLTPRRYNIFGGTIGGPVVRDRTHFFFSYEGNRQRDGATRFLNVPSPQQVEGDFSQTAGVLTDPVNRQPFAGNRIPASRLDPVGAGLAALYPAPNVPGAAIAANNFRANAADDTRASSIIARVDHVLTQKDRLMGRIVTFNNEVTTASITPQPIADPQGRLSFTDVWNLTGAWTRTFSPSFLNEFRYTIFWRQGRNLQIEPESGVAGRVGFRGVDPKLMPNLTITGLSGLGQATQRRQFEHYYPQQFTNTVSLYRGKHGIRFGGELRMSGMREVGTGTPSGTLAFNDVATGRNLGLAALLLGWPTSASTRVVNVHARSDYYALFLQDDWRVNRRLTLNLGIRWDMDTPRREANNHMSGFDPAAINPISNTPGSIVYFGRDGRSKYAHKFNKNNIAPRFGFAWLPFGAGTVVRGGYGLMYGPIYDASVANALLSGLTEIRQLTSPDNGLTPAFLLRDGFPQVASEPPGPGFGAVPVGRPAAFAPDFLDPNHRNNYAHHFNFAIQHSLRGGTLIEAGYLSNLGHHLSGPSVNINEIRPELRGAVQNQQLRPFPQYGNVTWISPNWGNSSYHALTLKAERRFANGLNLLSIYTWAKFLDDVEANSEIGGVAGNGSQSYYARPLDKAFSGNDLRHRLISSFVYELPVGRSRRLNIRHAVLDGVIGGWSLGMISELRSGLPFGATEASNRLNAFSSSQRPNLLADPVLSGSRPRSEFLRQWFDTSVFTFPGNGVTGNSPRNVASGPGSATFDFALIKALNFTEKRYLQIKAEFFNAFNRPNFGLPNGSRGNANFGQINSVGDGRVIQLGLRLVY